MPRVNTTPAASLALAGLRLSVAPVPVLLAVCFGQSGHSGVA
jgi:hypothetical protein